MYELTIRWFDTSYYDTPVLATQAEDMRELRRRLIGMAEAQNLSAQGDGQVGILVKRHDTIDGSTLVGVYEFTTVTDKEIIR